MHTSNGDPNTELRQIFEGLGAAVKWTMKWLPVLAIPPIYCRTKKIEEW